MSNTKEFGIIYCAHHLLTGKKYIGKTMRTMGYRRGEHLRKAKSNEHLCKRNNPFHEALLLTLPIDWIWTILDSAKNADDLSKKEIKWIGKLKTCNCKFGFNKRETDLCKKKKNGTRNRFRKIDQII